MFYLLMPILAFCQNPNDEIQMAGLLYENGKIYLVVLVLVTIFAGIILFLVSLERRLNKLEKKHKHLNS